MKNNLSKNFIKKISGGFTLVEVLIATTIFTIAVTGVVTVAVQGSVNISTAKNRLIANYLAQEGIELVRAKRDSYVLSSPTTYTDGWNNFIQLLSEDCTGPCDIDASSITDLSPAGSTTFVPCGDTLVACNLVYNPDGFYVHGTTGTQTPFIRELTFTPYYSTGTQVVEIEVNSTVLWKDGSNPPITVNESLFNWYTSH